MQTVDQGEGEELNEWFGADIELCIIDVGVETEIMLPDNLTKGEHVDGEEHGSKHRGLRPAFVDQSWIGVGVANGDKFLPV